jgi:cytochrome bd ubiquinol oxidase subunit I
LWSNSLSTVSPAANAAAAEPMTELGIYVHAFFLVLALGLPFLVLSIEFAGIRKKDHDYTHGAKIISWVWAVSFAFASITGTFVEFGLYLIWPGTILAVSSFWFIPFVFDLSSFLIEFSFMIAYLHFWEKINPWMHWLLGWGILIGSNLSAVAILAANSWMQAPWGTGSIVNKILPWVPNLGPNVVNSTAFQVLYHTAANTGPLNLANTNASSALGTLLYNPYIVLTNPDNIVTSAHTILAALLVATFETAAVFSYAYLKGGDVSQRPFYLKIMKAAYGVGAIAMFLQAFAGDQMARIVYIFQRIQFITFEGTSAKGNIDPPVGTLLYGNPFHFFQGYDYYNATASSSADPSAVIQSIDAAQQVQWLLHALYYVMVFSGLVLLIFGIAYFGLYSAKINRLVWFVTTLPTERFLIYTALVAPFIALAAGASGWAIREMGRHPWTVMGLIQYTQVVTPLPITAGFSALIMGIEIAMFVAGCVALYLIPTRSLEKGQEEIVIVRA